MKELGELKPRPYGGSRTATVAIILDAYMVCFNQPTVRETLEGAISLTVGMLGLGHPDQPGPTFDPADLNRWQQEQIASTFRDCADAVLAVLEERGFYPVDGRR